MSRDESEEVPIALKGSRQLIASYSLGPVKTKRWLVFLTESGSDFLFASRRELERLVGSKIAKRFNFLIINKPGQSPEGTDRKEFESSFRRATRIEDAFTTLKAVIPKSHVIYLVGYSEGAYLAPQVGRLDARVRSIVMIGGGTRGWLKEELSNAKRKEKASFEKRVREIYQNPKSSQRWNGFSYATWHSYRADNTLQALKTVRVPMLAILGARDRVIDLKSAIVDLILVSERKPVQIHVFGDCGHYFTKHWVPVSRVLARFLAEQLSK